MTTLATTTLAVLLLAFPQSAAKSVPATPLKAAPAAQDAPKRAEAPAPLKLGDPAPAFKVDEWVKGEKFESLESGKVHVLEFWATWCGPCITAIPHLTELQKKYPDVRFVGVASSESGTDEAAKLAKVKEFVDGKGDTMAYRVVYVGDRSKMSRPWMEAAGQSGIPCTFIVDASGRVAWIGHPMSMDKPLEQIVAGKYDVAKAAAEFEQGRAAKMAQRAISMAIRTAQQSGDWSPVVDALKAGLEKTPSDAMRMSAVQILAGPAKRPADAWGIAEEILRNQGDDAMAMNQLAWLIVDPQGGVAEPNLDIAMRAAKRACELSKNEDGSMTDTLARVHFAKGDVARAIELQKQALAKAPEGPMKKEMEGTLAEYETALKKG
jgi:thiol-disulfide isomerase/thioredoxin